MGGGFDKNNWSRKYHIQYRKLFSSTIRHGDGGLMALVNNFIQGQNDPPSYN